MTAASPLSQIIDDAERNGRLNLRTADIAQRLPGVSAEALRQALQRLQKKGRIVRASRGSAHWIIVPLQDAAIGAPPLESWLHAYLAMTLSTPYYVGLLSAAEIYGASPYAVMVTQVVVSKPRRPLQVGRHKLNFIVRSNLADIPTQWHETVAGRFKVSTAEATALELVQRQQTIGGLGRLIEVLHDLFDCCTPQGLAQALQAVDEVSAAQRLGVLLDREGHTELVRTVQNWLKGKRTRPILLSEEQGEGAMHYDTDFKVHTPEQLKFANA